MVILANQICSKYGSDGAAHTKQRVNLQTDRRIVILHEIIVHVRYRHKTLAIHIVIWGKL